MFQISPEENNVPPLICFDKLLFYFRNADGGGHGGIFLFIPYWRRRERSADVCHIARVNCAINSAKGDYSLYKHFLRAVKGNLWTRISSFVFVFQFFFFKDNLTRISQCGSKHRCKGIRLVTYYWFRLYSPCSIFWIW